MKHDERVARVAAHVKARLAARHEGEFASIGKQAISHFVPSPLDPRHRDRKIDVRDLREILEIDVVDRTCTAEPGVTFSDLVRATLPHGLAPMLVPELETITIGGAVAGCAVESTSYRHGGFHDSCVEYEIVTGLGEILRCSREENREIFEMMHGSYGTLGILTKLKFRLMPAAPFVRMDYRVYPSFEAFQKALFAACASESVDFVDAIVHAKDRFVLCLGRFAQSAPSASSYTGASIYYRSTLERREDHLSTYDYFFRYDTDCHWTSQAIPGMRSPLARRLFGKYLLGSTNMLEWARLFRPFARFQKHPPVVIDLFIPRRRFGEFYAWYEREIGYYPLWLVPYRMREPYPWIAPAHRARAGDDEMFIDVAVYGLRNDRVNYSALLEERTFELGGIKTLISENHYEPGRFWSIYDRNVYQRVKTRTDPHDLLRGLYEKFHYDRGTARVEEPREAGLLMAR